MGKLTKIADWMQPFQSLKRILTLSEHRYFYVSSCLISEVAAILWHVLSAITQLCTAGFM